MKVSDLRDWPVAPEEIDEILRMLKSFAKMHDVCSASIEISGDLPAHRGLGGGTAVRLAALEALATMAGVQVCPEALVAASLRGGTSGIGVRTYFQGGLVMDLGHRHSRIPGPSRDRSGAGQSLGLLRLEMPQWSFGLLSPNWLDSIPIEVERSIFANATSMDAAEVRDALYEIVYGLVAAAIEGDRLTFASAVNAIQSGAWKRSEWLSHGSKLIECLDDLRRAGAQGVGLSSFGPTLYFFPDLLNKSVLPSHLASCVRTARTSNRGRTVKIMPDA